MKRENKIIETMKKEVKDLNSAIEDNTEQVLEVVKLSRKIYKNLTVDLQEENLKKTTQNGQAS